MSVDNLLSTGLATKFLKPGIGSILMDDVQCDGSERRLVDCSHDTDTTDCSHQEDVAVQCSEYAYITCIYN